MVANFDLSINLAMIVKLNEPVRLSLTNNDILLT